MTVSHDVSRSYGVDLDARSPTFARPGRLAPQLGAPASGQVRAECTRCGTHLLAVPHGDGTLEGVCPVCLSARVTPVEAHRAAA
jgi:hypothetical protein